MCLTISWKSRWVGGPLNLEILREGGWFKQFRNSGERRGQNTVPSVVGVWIFSGMTQCYWGDVKQERWMVPIDSIPLRFTASYRAD